MCVRACLATDFLQLVSLHDRFSQTQSRINFLKITKLASDFEAESIFSGDFPDYLQIKQKNPEDTNAFLYLLLCYFGIRDESV